MLHTAYGHFPANGHFTRTDAAGNEVGDMDAIAQFFDRGVGEQNAVPPANVGAFADPKINYPIFFGTAVFNWRPGQVTMDS